MVFKRNGLEISSIARMHAYSIKNALGQAIVDSRRSVLRRKKSRVDLLVQILASRNSLAVVGIKPPVVPFARLG
jgi:hypothetical protein